MAASRPWPCRTLVDVREAVEACSRFDRLIQSGEAADRPDRLRVHALLRAGHSDALACCSGPFISCLALI